MLRLLCALFFIASCSMGTVTSGGNKNFIYDINSEYSQEDLHRMAPEVVITKQREPPLGKLEKLFGPGQSPIKRIGIVIFETSIQPTREGIAGEDKIYLNEQGKQLLTEKFLTIWEQSFPLLAPELNYVSTSKIKKAKSFHEYGSQVEDYVKAKRISIAPDDIYYLEKGKLTPTTTILNPRGMRDLSFILVPATELMGGPKFSEQNKHFLNDVAKELKLDAVIIVMSQASWTASRFEKHSGEIIPEQVALKISSSILLPLSQYHQRLDKAGLKSDQPNVTLCYRSYEAEIKFHALISLPREDQTFKNIEQELLLPLMRSYKDLAQMMMMSMTQDLKRTE